MLRRLRYETGVCTVPAPQCCAVGSLKPKGMQVQKAGSVGGVKFQTQRRRACWQRESHSLALMSYHPALTDFVLFAIACGLLGKQLGGEVGLDGQQVRAIGGRLDEVFTIAQRSCTDDKLVGAGIGKIQYMAGNGGGQGVERDAEL